MGLGNILDQATRRSKRYEFRQLRILALRHIIDYVRELAGRVDCLVGDSRRSYGIDVRIEVIQRMLVDLRVSSFERI